MLHVLLESPSPRARYVTRHVFERMMGWPLVFAASREELRSCPGAKLSYGALPVDGAVHVPASGWFDTPPKNAKPTLEGTGRELVIFPCGPRSDVLAAIFHLISLEAEYLPYSRDPHGRILANELPLVMAKAHEIPLADIWVLRLAEQLRKCFPELPEPIRTYRHVLTVDVDNGMRYAARSWQRAMGASAKDLATGGFARLFERWTVRMGGKTDPYAFFVDRLSEVRDKSDRMIAFVLTRGDGRFDHAARIDHPAYVDLLNRLAGTAEIGLHPSYESSRDERMIGQEGALLGKVTGRPIAVSRQHFLRWRMPDTFRALIANGFREDHSIGFSDRIGFRAGTCTPFPWYDLERDEETSLMMHPFAVMDSALADGSGEELRRGVGDMKRMSDVVREVNGTFVSVWHDRFLSGHAEFKGGPEAMRELVEHARA